MRPYPVLDPLSTPHFSSRKRLFDEHEKIHSWRAIARDRKIKNVWYVHRFAFKGIVPKNRSIARKLGIGVTINQLMKLPIQDMPAEILRLAFEHRTEMAA